MKRILLASVAALGLAGTASAADLAVQAPAVVPLFTWTGCYLGINGGWIGGNDEYTTSRRILAPGIDPEVAPLAAVNLVTHSYDGGGSAGTLGGQFGCQYQWGWFVLGGEWDANWSGLNEDNSYSYGPVTAGGFTFPARNEWSTKQLDWFSTARVRIGAAWWDRVLVYATGGLALGALDSSLRIDLPAGTDPEFFGAYREKHIGWTIGGGFEWAFAQNWTAKAEFLYLDFGSFDYISPRSTFGTTIAGVTDGRTWNTSIDAKEYVARVGINYLFHLGPAVAPVVARY